MSPVHFILLSDITYCSSVTYTNTNLPCQWNEKSVGYLVMTFLLYILQTQQRFSMDFNGGSHDLQTGRVTVSQAHENKKLGMCGFVWRYCSCDTATNNKAAGKGIYLSVILITNGTQVVLVNLRNLFGWARDDNTSATYAQKKAHFFYKTFLINSAV